MKKIPKGTTHIDTSFNSCIGYYKLDGDTVLKYDGYGWLETAVPPCDLTEHNDFIEVAARYAK